MAHPIETVLMPQWTHADFTPGVQAALLAAKMRLRYAGLAAIVAREAAAVAGLDQAAANSAARAAAASPQLPAESPYIAMYTGDLYEVFDFGDGRWGARLIRAAGPDGKLGETFVAQHGAEHVSLPEISTENIRVECGVVKLEDRVGGHDHEIEELRRTVKRLEAELAVTRGEVKGLRAGQSWKNEATQEAEEKVRVLEL